MPSVYLTLRHDLHFIELLTFISMFAGHQCCGPVVVYIAMTFIAGVLVTILVGFAIIRLSKAVSRYDGSEIEMIERAKRKFRSTFGRTKKNQRPQK